MPGPRPPPAAPASRKAAKCPQRPSVHLEPWEQRAVSLARWPKGGPRAWERMGRSQTWAFISHFLNGSKPVARVLKQNLRPLKGQAPGEESLHLFLPPTKPRVLYFLWTLDENSRFFLQRHGSLCCVPHTLLH